MPPDSVEKRAGVAKPRVRPSIYDAMLIVAFVALAIGILVLYLEWSAYPTTKASWVSPPAPAVLAEGSDSGSWEGLANLA